MKVSDLRQLQPGSYFTIKEPWRKEWEIGVQVSQLVLWRVYSIMVVSVGVYKPNITTHVKDRDNSRPASVPRKF